MKTFIVAITGNNGSYGCTTTDEIEFDAVNADDAKKQARAHMSREGWTRQDGTLTYKARVA